MPVELLRMLAEERQQQVLQRCGDDRRDVPLLAGRRCAKLGEFLQHARDEARQDLQAPVRFRPRPQAVMEVGYPDKTSEIWPWRRR